jgi:hypothetical protein
MMEEFKSLKCVNFSSFGHDQMIYHFSSLRTSNWTEDFETEGSFKDDAPLLVKHEDDLNHSE